MICFRSLLLDRKDVRNEKIIISIAYNFAIDVRIPYRLLVIDRDYFEAIRRNALMDLKKKEHNLV